MKNKHKLHRNSRETNIKDQNEDSEPQRLSLPTEKGRLILKIHIWHKIMKLCTEKSEEIFKLRSTLEKIVRKNKSGRLPTLVLYVNLQISYF